MLTSTERIRKEVKQIKEKRSIPSKNLIEDDIEEWEKTIEELEKGYQHSLDEYLNDLDLRTIIQLVIDQLSDKTLVKEIEAEVKPINERLRKLLVETDKCVWGKVNEWEYIPPEKYFWMWGIVNNAQDELLDDLTDPYQYVQFKYYNKDC